MNELALTHTEQTLLGSCLLARRSPPVAAGDFFLEKHAKITEVMQSLESEGIKPDLAVTSVKVYEAHKGNPSVTYLAEIYEQAGSADNIDLFSRMVREHAVARRMKKKAQQFLTELGSPNGKKPIEIASGFGAEILKSLDSTTSESHGDMLTGMTEFISDLEARMENGNQLVGLSTGLPKLDEITCGLCPQDLWILAARPSQGKTALALNIARSIAFEGISVLIFSLDMSAMGLRQRMAATEARINLAKIRSGNLSAPEYGEVIGASTRLGKLPITILDGPATELDIIQKSHSHCPGLIIIDYLTKVRPSQKTGNANYDYGEISKSIKDLV